MFYRPMTITERDAWVAQLRDPASEKYRAYGVYVAYQGSVGQCYCALGWLIPVVGERRANELWAQMGDTLLTSSAGNVFTAVTNQNDKTKRPLAEIADWIEKNVIAVKVSE